MYDFYCYRDGCLIEILFVKRVMFKVVFVNFFVLKEKFNEYMNDVGIYNVIYLINVF